MPLIKKLLNKILKNQKLKYIDIGAADELDYRWKKISPLLHYIGFEPDKRSEVIEGKIKYFKKDIFRTALWDRKTKIKFNLTRKPQLSSFYKPNFGLVRNFADFERFDIISSTSNFVKKLDDIKIDSCDFIKLDVQGGELNILKGANKLLKKCLGVMVEVEFISIYKEQPLFGDIVKFLKKHDIEFLDFISLTRWERDNIYSGLGQCTFADGLFIKSPDILINSSNFNVSKLERYISILLIYNRYDLIKAVSKKLSKKKYQHLSFLFDKLTYLQKRHNRLIKINNLYNRFLSFFYGKEYKSHIIY